MSEKLFWNKETLFVITLVVTCWILFFFGLGDIPIKDIDEAMHAATSRDMVLSGDWVTPRFNGKNFYDKTPLYNWLAAISFLIFGFTEFAARLPAALLGSGCVMITYWLARSMFGPVVAFLSALVLATSAEVIVLARVVVHDISLAFFVTLALTLFFVGYKNEEHRKPAFLFGYAALGFAVLAKGPVGVVLPMMIIGLFLICKRQLRFLKEMQIGWGLLIFLAVAAPWYILMSVRNPDYSEYFFLKQNIGSFLSQQSRHPKPFYYYIPVLMGGFFPWSLFLPLALFRAIRAKAALHGDGVIFALIWFGVVFIFFSMASSKLGTYILPLFPAAALLVGVVWHDLLYASNRVLHKGVFYSYLPFAGIMPLALVYLWLFPPGSLTTDTEITMRPVYFLAVWVVGCALLSIGLITKKKYRAFIGSIAGMAATLFLLVLIYIAPLLGPLISSKELALKLDKLLDPGESITFYLKARASFIFYTDRSAELLENPQQLMEYMEHRKKVYCVFKYDDWEDVANLHDTMQIVAKVGDKLIVSNRNSVF
jgi:4-amino-4-deoxy-L-arabinose transferase-like glycosyltransferase